MLGSVPFCALAWLGAPTDGPAPSPERTAQRAAPEPPSDYAEQAPLDVEAILFDTGLDYLHARARLVAHPELAAEALIERTSVVPAPGPAQRKRIMDVLAELHRPQDVDRFAAELRAAVTTDSPHKASEAADVWRGLLVEQGAAATDALRTLVADRTIATAIRGRLLEDLIAVSPSERLADLVVALGRGDPALREQLERGLQLRARADPDARRKLLAATDSGLRTALGPAPPAAEVQRLPALITFRTMITRDANPEIASTLIGVALDDAVSFATRVAAVRGLGRLRSPNAEQGLERIAATHLHATRRHDDLSEILGSLALDRIPRRHATQLAARLQLRNEGAPRLAALGYQLEPVGDPAAWLDAAQRNPWPQVRRAAYERVDSPCPDPVVRTLAAAAHPQADDESVAARAAVVALGRCASRAAFSALTRLLRDDGAALEQRAEAARQLVRKGGPEGSATVAKMLSDDLPRALARRLATALRYAPEATPAATQALCSRVLDKDEVARAAAESLVLLGFDLYGCRS